MRGMATHADRPAPPCTGQVEPASEDQALRALRVLARGLGERAAQLEPCVAEMYRWILGQFSKATPPTQHRLTREAGRRMLDLGQAIEALRALDLIQLDSGGDIVVAYPFSRDPTPHRVS